MEKRRQVSLLNYFQGKKSKTDVDIEVAENGSAGAENGSAGAENGSAGAENGSAGKTKTLLVASSSVSVACIGTPSSSGGSSNNGNDQLSLCLQNFPNENDIAILKKKITANCDYLELLRSIWKPAENYNFPSNSASGEKFSRRFQYAWFKKYPWLCYSKVEDAAYCKYCVFFSKYYVGHTSSQPTGYLAQEGFRKWKRALEHFNYHNHLEYHKTSFLHLTNLCEIQEGKNKSVDVLLDETKIKEAKENRDRLKPIVRTIILCGKQGLALRGHRDQGPIDIDELPSKNEGNFRALLRFAVHSGDKSLENHLRSAKKNALYTSYIIQNEIIETCGSIIQREIIRKVEQSKYFSVVIDETTDIATIEQMSFCLRYFDEEKIKICEHFLCFVPLACTTAKSISEAILKTLSSLGLDIKYLRGQGYDGARVMSGMFKGTQAYIAQLQPKAIYVHCMAHCLNLALSESCQVQDVRNCFGIIEKTYSFLHTAKRQGVLLNKIDEFCPESKKMHLKKLCPTRWVERHDSVMIFLELLEAVCECLEEISNWTDREASTGATGLITSICTVKFIVSLFVSDFLFSYSILLSRYLQKEELDLSVAVKHSQMLEDQLLDIRKNSDNTFRKLFTKATAMCQKLQVPVLIPRVNKRQIGRSNVDVTEPEAYYRISIFVPFLDSIISEVRNRFLVHKNILSSFSCLLSDTTNLNDFDELVKFYQDDLLENFGFINSEQLHAEFLLWKRKLKEFSNVKTVVEILSICERELFPNIHELLKIIAVIPVTTATAERSYSTLRRLKTYLRNTTGENRLTALALMNVYYDFDINVDKVLDLLAQKSRRMNIVL